MTKQIQTVGGQVKIYSPLGCNCYWTKNADGSDWKGEVCVEHVEEMIAQAQQEAVSKNADRDLKFLKEMQKYAGDKVDWVDKEMLLEMISHWIHELEALQKEEKKWESYY